MDQSQACQSPTSPSSWRRRRRISRLKGSVAREFFAFRSSQRCLSSLLLSTGSSVTPETETSSPSTLLPARRRPNVVPSQRPPSLQQRRRAREGSRPRPPHGRARTTARRYLHWRARCWDWQEGAGRSSLPNSPLLMRFSQGVPRERAWGRNDRPYAQDQADDRSSEHHGTPLDPRRAREGVDVVFAQNPGKLL